MSLNNLANLYSDLGRLDEAVPLYERCVDIVERYDGPTSPVRAFHLVRRPPRPAP